MKAACTPTAFQVAGQHGQDIPKRPVRVTHAGLSVTLPTSYEQLRVGFLSALGELGHQRRFSAACISQDENRQPVPGKSPFQVILEAG